MHANRLSRLLSAYVDGELPGQQQEAVMRLVRRSAQARALLRQLQEDAEILRALPARNVGQDLAPQILERIAATRRPLARSRILVGRSIPAWVGLAAAAAVLFALGIGTLLALRTPREGDSSPVIAPRPFAGGKTEGQGTEFAVTPKNSPAPALAPASRADTPTKSLPNPMPVVTGPENKAAPLPDKPSSNEFAVPVPEVSKLEAPEVHVALFIKPSDLEQKEQRQHLLDTLRIGRAHRIDLICAEAPAALESVRGALTSQHIHPIIDRDAQDVPGLRPRSTGFVVYMEYIAPDEVVGLLRKLRKPERKSSEANRPAQFENIGVNTMTAEDDHYLTRLLGTDPLKSTGPNPKSPGDVTIRKPLSEETAAEVERSLKGQGGALRPQSSESQIGPSDRLAIVLPNDTGHRYGVSREVRQFLSHHKEARAGTLRVLLVVRALKQ
jgi:hypothetical protein